MSSLKIMIVLFLRTNYLEAQSMLMTDIELVDFRNNFLEFDF